MAGFLQRKWSEVLALFISAIAVVMSAWSLSVAREANQLSVRSNEIAHEANGIASDANRLTLAAAKSEIVVFSGSNQVIERLSGCTYNGVLSLNSSVYVDLVLANVGIKSANLIDLQSDSPYMFEYIKGSVDDRKQSLPVLFEPGYKAEWEFVIDRHSYLPAPTLESVAKALESVGKDAPREITLRMLFDDGNVVVWSGRAGYLVPNPEKLYQDCTETAD